MRNVSLSKGNKQKVGLLLAFAPKVELMVLDEPTSGLDPLLQREFGLLLSEVVAGGAAVLLSSHVMSEVEQVATRVALMRDGGITVVDDLSSITAAARRRGRVVPATGEDREPLEIALTRTPGVTDVTVDAGAVRFACTGEMGPLLKTLAGFSVRSLDVTHADLEDAFFSAYDDTTDVRGAS